MKFPFVSRKAAEAAYDELLQSRTAAWAEWAKQDDKTADLLAENAQLKQALADVTAAAVIAAGLNAVALAIEANVKAIASAAERAAHTAGALALAQHKAADVQREWLEVSKGNR